MEKVSKGKRVATRVRQLGEEDRVAEIARLLGGDADSDLGREHARALLAEAARHG
ncbi:MAG: hypothetical protein BWZ10_02388 [candidate division BRC1 bacterium ADurb.BinA364]|nr:MAG: hypothetical protein BWZ10_02388 [candidate division BRC1 bacterium ADurb.BinA364]